MPIDSLLKFLVVDCYGGWPPFNRVLVELWRGEEFMSYDYLRHGPFYRWRLKRLKKKLLCAYHNRNCPLIGRGGRHNPLEGHDET